MAKSKTDKRIEAAYRKVRGDLVSEFRLGTDEEVTHEFGRYHLEKRDDLIQQYMEIPQSVRDTLMDGWILTPELKVRLELAQIEQNARLIESATPTAQSPARQRRM